VSRKKEYPYVRLSFEIYLKFYFLIIYMDVVEKPYENNIFYFLTVNHKNPKNKLPL